MSKTTYTTTRLETDIKDFYVEVSAPYEEYDFYLCHKNYDHKMYMFRMPTDTTEEQWMDMVNYLLEVYVQAYWSEITAFEEFNKEEAEKLFWESFDDVVERNTRVEAV